MTKIEDYTDQKLQMHMEILSDMIHDLLRINSSRITQKAQDERMLVIEQAKEQYALFAAEQIKRAHLEVDALIANSQ